MSGNHLEDLTEAQRRAVTHIDGPMLVLAGPGSGKTRVITQRIAHLIKQGISPTAILALTFTNKAAEEMRSRLKKMEIPKGPLICTFHSLCVRLLREFSDEAGLQENFSIFDGSDQKSAIKEALKGCRLDSQKYTPQRILSRISRLKNQGIPPEKLESGMGFDPLSREIGSIYRNYQNILKQNAALDFDDLLLKCASILQNSPAIRDRLNRRYGYLLVDEYQDTNLWQYRIARELSRNHSNLFVTGDPDQSIYGWRGADIGNILTFEKDFPGAGIVRLEENFRSSPQVLRLADHLIQANSNRKQKRLIANKPNGKQPRLYRFADEYAEAEGASAWIAEMRHSYSLEYQNIAVFYRINSMSRVLEEALRAQSIPYRIIKGIEFYHRKEIKDILAYLRILVNPSDLVSLKRIINRPARGIGSVTIKVLFDFLQANGHSIESMLEPDGQGPSLGEPALSRLEKFRQLILDLRRQTERPVTETIQAVYQRTGMEAALTEAHNEEAQENIQELVNSAAQFDKEFPSAGIKDFLHQVALVSDTDVFESESGAVSLMTLHAAKGLEFPAVLIAGVEDGLIPHGRSIDNSSSLEEERRLLFVGMTRAERILALSYASRRAVGGAPKPSAPSRFLIGLQGLERDHSGSLHSTSTGIQQRISTPYQPQGISSSLSSPNRNPPGISGECGTPPRSKISVLQAAEQNQDSVIREGRRVRHPSLGIGLVEKILPGQDSSRVIVQFETGSRLTIDLKFARLELMD